jgi:hypothetical protein
MISVGTCGLHMKGRRGRGQLPMNFGEGSNRYWVLTEDTSVNLTDAEINLLIRANQKQFMMDLMLVIARYQSINGSMREYLIRYDAIMVLMPIPDEMNKEVVVFRMNREQYMNLKPYSNAL